MTEPASQQLPRDYLVVLTSLLPRVIRSAWVGGVVFAVGLAATATWALLTSRQYRSEAVLVHEQGVQSASLGVAEGESPRHVAAQLQEMMTSRKRLEGIIKDLRLYHGIVEQRSMVDAIDEMRRHLYVGAREGFTFRVSFDAESRDVAQRVLDMLTKGVVEDDRRRRLQEADETKKFLDAERKRADDDMKTKEAALSAFLTQHPALAAEATGGVAAAGGLLRAAQRTASASSDGEIASLEMQRANIQRELHEAGLPANLPPGGDPALIAARARAETELHAAQRELADKQSRLTNEHPDVKAAFRHVAEAEAALRRDDAALAASRGSTPSSGSSSGDDGRIDSLRQALSAVNAQLATLRSRSGSTRVDTSLRGGTTATVDIDTEWTRLNREVMETRERQGQLETKQAQANLVSEQTLKGLGGRLVIVDPPYRPTHPIAGARFKIAAVGGMGSLMIGVLAILLLAAFDDRLYASRDVERVVKEGFVVVVPKLVEKGG